METEREREECGVSVWSGVEQLWVEMEIGAIPATQTGVN